MAILDVVAARTQFAALTSAFSVELPGIEPGPDIGLSCTNAGFVTRNDAEAREMTCAYAKSVDAINIPATDLVIAD
jgi:hypothetical protein